MGTPTTFTLTSTRKCRPLGESFTAWPISVVCTKWTHHNRPATYARISNSMHRLLTGCPQWNKVPSPPPTISPQADLTLKPHPNPNPLYDREHRSELSWQTTQFWWGHPSEVYLRLCHQYHRYHMHSHKRGSVDGVQRCRKINRIWFIYILMQIEKGNCPGMTCKRCGQRE